VCSLELSATNKWNISGRDVKYAAYTTYLGNVDVVSTPNRVRCVARGVPWRKSGADEYEEGPGTVTAELDVGLH
jgi:hypothetical protein